jgi:AcrR family transcriptional regulator
MSKKAGPPASHYPQTKATEADWLQAALDMLISAGVERVKILDLAARLGVSRSSFYWYFTSRQDLLNQLLRHWRETNTRGIVGQASLPAASIMEAVVNIFACWTDRRLFDPKLDFAMREWARRSKAVHRVVQQADEERVAAIQQMFQRQGYAANDAFTRARVLYFMQIGYYALDLKEGLEQRLAVTAEYLRAFTGQEPEKKQVDGFIRMLRRRAIKQRG